MQAKVPSTTYVAYQQQCVVHLPLRAAHKSPHEDEMQRLHAATRGTGEQVRFLAIRIRPRRLVQCSLEVRSADAEREREFAWPFPSIFYTYVLFTSSPHVQLMSRIFMTIKKCNMEVDYYVQPSIFVCVTTIVVKTTPLVLLSLAQYRAALL